ncbi:MAG TPA: FprA family A-type flavoprotein [Salinivirgaceae bacterium]|nr:FprA family A-type flavoprotein [Salinivirgaceae bacterium]
MRPIKLHEDTFLLAVNDRRTHLFENYWPIPNGVAYNSYLILDNKTALIDTVEYGHSAEYIDNITSLLKGKPLDYLIINHMEPDHSGSIKIIMDLYPNCTLVGNKRTFPLIDGYFNIEIKNKQVVEEGDTIELGKHKLSFYMIPMVHWPETMVTYDSTNKVLFSADAFGSFGTHDGGVFDDEINIAFFEDELRRYYSNIVGKYGQQVQKALSKLSGLKIDMLAATHGPIWRKDLNYILNKYDLWSKYQAEEKGAVIVFGSMYGNTEIMADTIARELSVNGVKNIRVYDSSKTHKSYIISDIWKYNGLVLGSCAYNAGIFTPMGDLINSLDAIGIKNRHVALFGSSSWGGGGLRVLEKWAENMKFDTVGPKPEVRCSPKQNDIELCSQIGREMAKVILER